MQKVQIILIDPDFKSKELIFSTDIDLVDTSTKRLFVKGMKDYIKDFAKEEAPEGTLSTREVADILDVSGATVNIWAKKEGLPRIETRSGYPNRFNIKELSIWLKEHRKTEYQMFQKWLDSQKQQFL